MQAGRLLATVLVAAVTLAGCSGGKGGAQEGDPTDAPVTGLHGWVVDLAIRPLEGATVKVIDTNTSVVTGADGGYGLEGLPVEQFLVVVATKPGFKPSSKQVSLSAEQPVRLNFTLEPEPTLVPYGRTEQFTMMVGCQAAYEVSGQNESHDCAFGTLEHRDTWQFSVEPNLAGAVIEVVWDMQSPAGESLGARLETLELGKLNEVLGEVVGSSPLRMSVPESAARKLYREGGLMRLQVYAQSNGEEIESGVGASFHFQQVVDAFATLCYVKPPAAAYSLAAGSRPGECQDG